MTGAASEEFGDERRGVRLSTPRLLLRPVETGDLYTFLRLWTDPVVRRHLGGPVPAHHLDAYRRAAVGRAGVFAVTARAGAVPGVETGVPLGYVELRPDPSSPNRTELSYGFLPEATGQGLAREAVGAVLDRHRCGPGPHDEVIAVTRAANGPSLRLLEAVGLREVERFERWDADQVLYSSRGSATAGEPSGRGREKGWTSPGRASGVGP
ncbi:GNAT family N-acetyltransferase [Streptomyces albidoflavus]